MFPFSFLIQAGEPSHPYASRVASLHRSLFARARLPNHPVTPKGQKYALYLVENIDTC